MNFTANPFLASVPIRANITTESQKYVAIDLSEFGWKQNEIVVKFEFWWKNYSWNDHNVTMPPGVNIYRENCNVLT